MSELWLLDTLCMHKSGESLALTEFRSCAFNDTAARATNDQRCKQLCQTEVSVAVDIKQLQYSRSPALGSVTP